MERSAQQWKIHHRCTEQDTKTGIKKTQNEEQKQILIINILQKVKSLSTKN